MNFTIVDNSLLQDKTVFKSPAQKLTYIFLMSFANCEKVFPSISKIAEGTCQSERTTMRIIKELEGLGFIKVERTTGKSNVYTLVAYDKVSLVQNDTSDNMAVEPVTNCQLEPVSECHTKSNNLLKTKNKNNNISNNINYIGSTKESIITELINQFPNVPVQEIANEIDSNDSVDVKTVKQFKGLLTYKVKNHKPMKQETRKTTVYDTRNLPNYFEEFKKLITN